MCPTFVIVLAEKCSISDNHSRRVRVELSVGRFALRVMVVVAAMVLLAVLVVVVFLTPFLVS